MFAQVQYMLVGPELNSCIMLSTLATLSWNYFTICKAFQCRQHRKREEEKEGRKKRKIGGKKEAAVYFSTEFHSDMITGGVSMRAEGRFSNTSHMVLGPLLTQILKAFIWTVPILAIENETRFAAVWDTSFLA